MVVAEAEAVVDGMGHDLGMTDNKTPVAAGAGEEAQVETGAHLAGSQDHIAGTILANAAREVRTEHP